MIPENKQIAVQKALQAAFGAGGFDDIRPLTKGLSSALIFRIMVKGKPYLLRVITRTDAMGDPTHYFKCMEVAAKAGLAPAIHYGNVEERISITDFIEEQSFPLAVAREKMPGLLHQLHSLPSFPSRVSYLDALDDYIGKFRASNALPDALTEDIFEQYQRIRKVYPRHDPGNAVSCHNDLKPENIIYDGLRPWLIDWEAAFLNDRYVDLVVVGNFVIKNEKDEADFLSRYFGEAPDEYKHARFFLMTQLVNTFYFTIFLLLGAAGKAIDLSVIDKPGFREYHDRIWNGEISLAGNEAKVQYGLAHLEQVRHAMNTKRFEDSLLTFAAYPDAS